MPLPEQFLQDLSPEVVKAFLKWSDYLREKINFSRPESPLHALDHTGRVLLYALMLCEDIYPEDSRDREILAHAAIFHDTRRKDDSYDTGHGARAAIYYEQFCRDSDLEYYPEAAAIMRFHDIDDKTGIKEISLKFSRSAEQVIALYKIFKDADALDRWRLGPDGLDEKYLRYEESKNLVNFARELVKEMDGQCDIKKLKKLVRM